jgi:ribosomal protein L31E
MKRTFLLLLLFSPFWSYSQQLISMADAISKGRTSLAPSSLRQLQWIPDSDKFSHVAADKIAIFSARDMKSDTLDLLPALNEKLTAQGARKLDRIPAITWNTPDKFWFQHESVIYASGYPGKQPETPELVPAERLRHRYPRQVLFHRLPERQRPVGEYRRKGTREWHKAKKMVSFTVSRCTATNLASQKEHSGAPPDGISHSIAWMSAW